MSGWESRFYIDHGMVHDRKTGKHLVGCDYAGERPETLLTVLHELENDRDAWRMTARAFEASNKPPNYGGNPRERSAAK